MLEELKKKVHEANTMLPQYGVVIFTWGRDPFDAVHNCVVLETLAEMALKTLLIDPEADKMQDELLDKHFLRKHGPGAYYGQG